MKVARLYSYTDIRIEEYALPDIGPRDVLMKTRACGICSGDVMPWYIEKKAPLVIGHEPSGEIVATGDDVQGFQAGDRIFVHHHAPCNACRCCLRGDFVQCSTWKSSSIIPGGVSEYVLIPDVNLRHDTLKLPQSVGFEDGSLVEPCACVVKSLSRAGIRHGDTLLVLGLGVMGQLHVLLARTFGAERIIGVDFVRYRRDKAKEFGADVVLDAGESFLEKKLADITGGRMADVVIVGPNSAEAMELGINLVAPGGSIVFFTPAKPGEMLTIDPNRLYFRDAKIITSYSCGPDDTRRALGYIEQGVVSAAKLVTHRFPIEETEKAYRFTAEARDSLKCLIVFSD